MTDIYPNRPASECLQDMVALVRRHMASAQRMNLDTLTGLHANLRDIHREVLVLEQRSASAAEMEEITRDLDLIGHAKSGQIGPKMGEVVDLRSRLAADQRVIQERLDAEADISPRWKGKVEAFHRRALQAAPSTSDGGDAA